MLTRNQREVLEASNYDLGRFYVRLNLKDDDDINWFEKYEKDYDEHSKVVEQLQEMSDAWNAADLAEREEIVREKLDKRAEAVENNIEESKEKLKGLSKALTEMTQLSGDEVLDSDHVTENNLMVELLEELSTNKAAIESMKKTLTGIQGADISEEVSIYDIQLRDSLKFNSDALVTIGKNRELMRERKVYLMNTFQISEEEFEEIKQEIYG